MAHSGSWSMYLAAPPVAMPLAKSICHAFPYGNGDGTKSLPPARLLVEGQKFFKLF